MEFKKTTAPTVDRSACDDCKKRNGAVSGWNDCGVSYYAVLNGTYPEHDFVTCPPSLVIGFAARTQELLYGLSPGLAYWASISVYPNNFVKVGGPLPPWCPNMFSVENTVSYTHRICGTIMAMRPIEFRRIVAAGAWEIGCSAVFGEGMSAAHGDYFMSESVRGNYLKHYGKETDE